MISRRAGLVRKVAQCSKFNYAYSRFGNINRNKINKGKSTYLVLLPETNPFSKRKQRKQLQRKKKVVLAPNPSRRHFSFPSCHWFLFFQSWRVLYKNQSTCPRAASSIKHLECLVQFELFLHRSGGFLLRECTVFMGKKFYIHPSRYEKDIAYKYYPIFFRNYALRAELCGFASAHNSGSPENYLK